MEIGFTVPGKPRGKGRPRFSGSGRAYTDRDTVAYEDKVVACYRERYRTCLFEEGAVHIAITAYYPIPKSATKKMRLAMESNQVLPCKKPDVDNVAKIVLDALNGIAFHDDAQVCRLTVEKFYGEPRVEIRIKEGG
mgnify:CR=1 FL=1